MTCPQRPHSQEMQTHIFSGRMRLICVCQTHFADRCAGNVMQYKGHFQRRMVVPCIFSSSSILCTRMLQGSVAAFWGPIVSLLVGDAVFSLQKVPVVSNILTLRGGAGKIIGVQLYLTSYCTRSLYLVNSSCIGTWYTSGPSRGRGSEAFLPSWNWRWHTWVLQVISHTDPGLFHFRKVAAIKADQLESWFWFRESWLNPYSGFALAAVYIQKTKNTGPNHAII